MLRHIRMPFFLCLRVFFVINNYTFITCRTHLFVTAIHGLQKVSKRNPNIYQQIADQLKCPQNVNISDCNTLMSPWIRYLLSHRRHK